jgi:hypothetical protein
VTGHELAGLLDHLRQGLGGALTKKTADDFAAAATALREIPDQPLKEVIKGLQKLATPTGGAGLDKLLERIRACRAGAVRGSIRS